MPREVDYSMNNWDRYVAKCRFLNEPALPNTGEWQAHHAKLYARCVAMRDDGVAVPDRVFGFKDAASAA